MYYNFVRERQIWKDERKCEKCEWEIRKKQENSRINSVNSKKEKKTSL